MNSTCERCVRACVVQYTRTGRRRTVGKRCVCVRADGRVLQSIFFNNFFVVFFSYYFPFFFSFLFYFFLLCSRFRFAYATTINTYTPSSYSVGIVAAAALLLNACLSKCGRRPRRTHVYTKSARACVRVLPFECHVIYIYINNTK